MTIQVFAKTHPNPTAVLAELAVAEQLGLAALEPHPIEDAAIVEYQDAVAGIRRALAANPLYSQNPHP
jgi:hypothetical protein